MVNTVCAGVEERRGLDGLATIGAQWSELCDRAVATPFQRPEWLLPFARSFEGHPVTVAIKVGGELVAVLPLVDRAQPRVRPRGRTSATRLTRSMRGSSPQQSSSRQASGFATEWSKRHAKSVQQRKRPPNRSSEPSASRWPERLPPRAAHSAASPRSPRATVKRPRLSSSSSGSSHLRCCSSHDPAAGSDAGGR